MAVLANAIPTGGREQTDALRRCARNALARSAAFTGVVLGPLDTGDRGQPLPSRGIHWSLSHTSGCVAAVTAPLPVGIDVERIAPFTTALMERCAQPAEWALASPVDEALFCRFWTAKEAVLKATGAGLSGLPRCSVVEIVDESELLVSFQSVTWTVSHCFIVPGHVAAITTPIRKVIWHLVELGHLL